MADRYKIVLAKGTSAQTITGDGGLITTPMTLVETATPSAAANFTFSSLSPSKSYLLVVNVKQNTAGGNHSIQFNADTTAGNYSGNTLIAYNNTHTAYSSSWDMQGAYNPPTNGFQRTYIYFSTQPGDDNSVTVQAYGSGKEASANTQQVFLKSMLYSGASPLSSIKYLTSAGTLTGTASLYTLN